MILHLRIGLIVLILVFALLIVYLLKKQKLNLKYILLWLFSIFIMLIAAIFPQITNYLSKVLGIIDPTNTVFMIAGGMALLIILGLTVIVTTVTNRIYSITQHQAILEKRIRELEKEMKSK